MKALVEKYEKIENLFEYYKFPIDIRDMKTFKDVYNDNIRISHSICQKEFDINFKDFFVKMNYLKYEDISPYLVSDSDIMCPYCLQKAKNRYFNNIIDEKFDGKYELVGDFKAFNEKVKIKHKICGNILELKASNLVRVKTEPNCSMCSSLLTRAEKMRQYRMLDACGRYEFSVDVRDKYIFKEYLEKEVGIYHKTCGKTYNSTLKDFHKINTGSLKYLFSYVKDKSDLNCPHCLQEAKNRYFQEVLDNKTNNQYDLVGDYNISNSKVLIRHKICKEVMEIWASNVISSDMVFKCSHCVKILKHSERIKQNNFIKALDYYEFPFNIKEQYLFKNNLENMVEIKHKTCGRKFSIEFGRFNETNVGRLAYLRKYLATELDIKCPHCLQEAKNKYFEEILYDLTKGDFVLVGNYNSKYDDVEILHKSCEKTFKINAEAIVVKKRISCPMCLNEDNKYQRKIQKKKNSDFNKELKKKDLEEFKITGNYIDRNTVTTFLHKECGYKFEDTPSRFLRRVNKCPNCTGNNRVIFKNQEEKNEVFQRNLDYDVEGFKLIGDYTGKNKDIRLYHEKCKKEFTTRLDYFISSKYRCPHCESKRYRYDKDITIKEKIRYIERDIGSDYKLLTGFTTLMDVVKIKHKKCGKVFEKTVNQAVRRKGNSILCPYCEKKSRREKFLEKLDKKWNGSYELIGEYINLDTKTTFKHLLCKNKFEATPNQILSKEVNSCPKCVDKNIHKEDKFKIKLLKKHKSRYSILSEYKRYDKKVLFKDNECGSLFWETPFNMLKKDLPCKKCATKKRIIPFREVQDRVKLHNGDMYKLVGEYMGTEKELPVICNKCGHVFEIAPVKLFRLKVCPNCKERHKR